MSKKIIIKIGELAVVLLLLAGGLSAGQIFAQEQSESAATAALPLPAQDQDEKARKAAFFLQRLKLEINKTQDELDGITENIDIHSQKLTETQTQIKSLQDQLRVIDEQIKNIEEQIENVKKQIKTKKIEIENLEHEIAQKKIEIEYQKQILAGYLKSIYQDQGLMTNFNIDNLEINTIKLLLNDQTVGQTLTNLRYSELLEVQGRDFFENLSTLIEEAELKQKLMELKKAALQKLNLKLADQEVDLEETKATKITLLEQTKGQEHLYQELLSEFKKQQDEASAELTLMTKNLEFVRKKMAELGSNFDPADFAGLLNGNTQSDIMQYLKANNVGEFTPIWPIAPLRGISAYFQDASYKAHFGFAHNAIDIPAAQGTPIKAAADGFVFKAKDNGLGYSYIVLLHKNGYMTVYGHVFEILVSTGDFVKAGETIGLSGGKPATRGAGPYTTGPHLHFEVIKDKSHVDPMIYMNLAYLDLSRMPEKYLMKAIADRDRVKRSVSEGSENKEKVKRTKPSVDELVELNGELAKQKALMEEYAAKD